MYFDFYRHFITIFGRKIESMNKNVYFSFCVFNVLFFHTMAGLVQEALYSKSYMKNHGLFLSAIFFFFNFVFSFSQLNVTKKLNLKNTKKSWKPLSVLGLLLAGSIGLSNYSFRYLTFTTQVMVKCCKPVMVLIGSCLIQKRQFTIKKISACICITLGVAWFSILDSKFSRTSQYIGILLIFTALLIDAISPNIHEILLKDHNLTMLETLMFPSLIGLFSLITIDCLISDFIPAFENLLKVISRIVFHCRILLKFYH
uniref:Adenosine 3'-phospho 5'-phosphosulfate transporter 2 n=1 Tax=Henneguya salminicola TaxID=69463 RepID=A0A6G3MF91_HENSL